MLAAQAIKGGDAEVVVAGGLESMSRAPFLLPGARWGERLGHGKVLDHMIHEGLTDAFHDIHMGITAENLAERYDIGREEQDAFAAESQARAAAAIARRALHGRDRRRSPWRRRRAHPNAVEQDEHPRPETTRESLARLKPAFKKDGTRDRGQRQRSQRRRRGAGRRLGARTRARARAQRRWPASSPTRRRASIPRSWASVPCPRSARRSQKAGLEADAIDLFELNEAFAAQSLAVLRELKLDPARVNVNGGAIALGHPIGASGARILVTLLHALEARAPKRGLASLCIGGGQGVAMIVERS